ncbi:MAG: hypothetical protein NUW23_00025 [Firmicutes bacterium]|jgi:hypothetical protein|nr:hypothetical protein [Bacillota bacterium]
MKKYAVPALVIAIILAASGLASATHISAGYVSRDGGIHLTLGGRYDLGRGSSVEGSYTMLPHGFEAAARYKIPMMRGTIVAGPVFEGRLIGYNPGYTQTIAGGVFAEKVGVTGLGLYGSLTFRQHLNSPVSGLVAGVGARMSLNSPLFVGAEATMGLSGGVAGTEVAFTVGYTF